VTSSGGSTIGEFHRNRRDGALTYDGCLSAANRLRVDDPCRHIPRRTKPNIINGIEGLHEIAVTPYLRRETTSERTRWGQLWGEQAPQIQPTSISRARSRPRAPGFSLF
jgi:hypothetical protein